MTDLDPSRIGIKENNSYKTMQKISFKKSWLIWGCAALFYCYQFMLRVSPGVMTEDLMLSFQVDACALGTLTGFYYYTYSAMQIPIGSLMDYFKPRRMLCLETILCSLGVLLFSSADSIYTAAFGRALIGAGSAAAFLSCLKLGTLWFPSQTLPLVIGMTVLLGTTGAISAGTPMAWLVHSSGWRHALWFTAFIGFALAILSWLMVRDKAPTALEEEIRKSHGDEENIPSDNGILTNIIEVIRKPQSWLIALYGFFLYVPLSGFSDLWGPPFLMAVYGFDVATAGFVNSVLYIGIGFGSPLFPFICKWFRAYKPTIFISSFGAFLLLSAVFYLPTLPFWVLVALLFFAGVFLSGQFLGFSMTCALNPLSASATAGGFHNMICMLSGVIFHRSIGWLLDYSWQGNYVNGVRSYTTFEYKIALSSIIGCLFLACCIIFLIKEKYPRE
jgi:sugar phosphate permease